MSATIVLDRVAEIVECVDRSDLFARRRIGASDAAAIMGVAQGHWSSAYAIWARLTNRVPIDSNESELSRWGHIMEGPIAQEYERLTGRKTFEFGPNALCVHPTRPYMTCIPDRGVAPCDGHNGPGLLQIKTRAFFKLDEWKDGAPLDVQVQVQHEMAVTGYRWASIAVLVWGKPLQWLDVERNDTFIAALEQRCETFWSFVERDEAPEADGSEATTQAIKAAFPMDIGEVKGLGDEAVEWFAKIAELRATKASAEKELKLYENKARAAVGDATVVVLPNGDRWSCKATQRAGYTVEPTIYRTLRRMKDEKEIP